jgi:predicted transcriptional regulator
MPVGMIVAEFDIADVIEDKPSTVWKKTCRYAGISKGGADRKFLTHQFL